MIEPRNSAPASRSPNQVREPTADDSSATLRSTPLAEWELQVDDDEVLKLTAPAGEPSRTALVHYAPWSRFALFGRRFSLRSQWKAELVCTERNVRLYCETFDSKRDAIDGLVEQLY